MGTVTERFLICDGNFPGCHGNYGVDNRHMTFQEHRQSAKSDGWTQSGNKDYCPCCTAERRKKNKDHN